MQVCDLELSATGVATQTIRRFLSKMHRHRKETGINLDQQESRARAIRYKERVKYIDLNGGKDPPRALLPPCPSLVSTLRGQIPGLTTHNLDVNYDLVSTPCSHINATKMNHRSLFLTVFTGPNESQSNLPL